MHTAAPTAAASTPDKFTEWRSAVLQDRISDSDVVAARPQELLSICIDPQSLGSRAVHPDRNTDRNTDTDRAIHPGGHLLLFPLRAGERQLAADGYDAAWAPPPPHVQRMWAAGSVRWNPRNPLRTGQQAHLDARVIDVHRKQTAARGDAVFVTAERTISNSSGVAVQEERSYVYLRPIDPSSSSSSSSSEPSSRPDFSDTLHPSTISLFRYSALTYNSHLIHYDHNFATQVEGYEGCLVHGPLTFTLLLDLFVRHSPPNTSILKFTYRALSPLVVGQDITLNGKWLEKTRQGDIEIDGADSQISACELWATSDQGAIAMKGTLEYVATPDN
eukprot:jgi/Hompol1/4864/HPOL_003967-RA